MVEPKTVAKTVLVPNPTRAGKPARPSAILVGATGRPDAKGIIAPFPGAPVGPVGPVGPTAPAGPVSPVGPVAPIGPVGPVGPVGPAGPVGPVGPVEAVSSSITIKVPFNGTCIEKFIGAVLIFTRDKVTGAALTSIIPTPNTSPVFIGEFPSIKSPCEKHNPDGISGSLQE